MEEVLSGMTMPPGYRWSFDGAFRQDDEAGAQMAFNTLIALLMIYVVMAAVFESLLFPAAIMSSILSVQPRRSPRLALECRSNRCVPHPCLGRVGR